MKKARRITFTCLLLLVLCSGCASGSWSKQGATDAEFKQDVYACKRDMQFAFAGTEVMPFVRNRFFRDCMESKGYRWAK